MKHTNTIRKHVHNTIMPAQNATSILLIDDSESTNFYNKMIVERTIIDADVTIANNGLDALEAIRKLKKDEVVPDFIFLDINMPVMDGWEFLATYDRTVDFPKTSTIILMLGAELSPSDRERIQDMGLISGFSEKMLKKETLLNLVTMYL